MPDCPLHGRLRRGHRRDNAANGHQQHRRQRSGEHHEKRDGIADAFRRAVLVPRAHGLTVADSRAHGKPDDAENFLKKHRTKYWYFRPYIV